jgi:hypothetical protein
MSGFLGIALAVSAALVACGDGDDADDDDDGAPAEPAVKSGEGESCARTDDCAKGLACYNLVCVEDPSPPTAGTGGGGGGNAGSGNRAGTGGMSNPGRLSGDGESCTKTSDCEASLACYNLRCQERPTPDGEGGEQNLPDPVLGARGETCVLSSDCQPELVCMPSDGQTGSVGVCSPKDSGLEATGKTCSAECAEDEDCCQVPIEEHGALGVKSCTELSAVLEGIDCATSTDAVALRRCFARAAYCDCEDDNPWSCSDGGCQYEADCSVSGVVPGGCPQYTRSGRVLSTACDIDGSEKCSLPSTCMVDDDCTALAVSDDPGDICATGECTCYDESVCLRKCDGDFDCAAGKTCDPDTNVCIPSEACTSDEVCQVRAGDYRWTCSDAGVCTRACEFDIDCNALTNGSLRFVCTEGTCQLLGCEEDDECELMTDPQGMRRRMFCAAPVAGTTTASSAITD